MTAGLSWNVRRRLYQQASNQIENGLAITQVLGDFRDRLQRRRRKKAALAAHEIYRKVRDGETLRDAMGPALPDLESSVLASGEKAGQLPAAMRLVVDVRDRTTRMQRHLFGSFFSPLIYLIAFYSVLFTIGYSIVPQFTENVPVEKWKGWAYVLYVMGQAAVGWEAPLVFGGALVATAVACWSLRRWTGAGRLFCDRHVFPFTVYREVTGFAWLLSFAALLKAGVADTEALKSQIISASHCLGSRLTPVAAGLRDGFNLASAMRRSGFEFPSVDLIEEIDAYVAFPNFADVIEKVAKEYAESLERRILRRGMAISFVFLLLMYFAFAVVQLGSNSLSALFATTMGSY
jgi:type II secretory pathway component PulF